MKRFLFVFQFLAGIALILAGEYIFISDSMKALSGLCIGIGAALAALGIGWLIQSLVVSATENEAISKAKLIEVQDERNTRIREKTGYMTSKIMNYVLVFFIFVLMFIGANQIIILLAVSLLIVEFALVLIFSNFYSKKM